MKWTGRITRSWLVVLVAAMGMLALAAPANAAIVSPVYHPGCNRADNANYGCNVSISSLSYYKGWAHVSGLRCGGPIGIMERLHDAWRWSNGGWQHTNIAGQTQVYVWPFTVGWSWVWTQETNWIAMPDSDLVINPYCDPRILYPLATTNAVAAR